MVARSSGAPPSRPRAGDLISDQTIATLWALALSSPLRTPGFGGGEGAPLRLTPRELEHMILDHIDEELPALQSLTAARRGAAPLHTFQQWLSTVSENALTADQLRPSIRNALQTIIECSLVSDHTKMPRGHG